MELMRPMRPDGDRADVLCANCGSFDISGRLLVLLENNFSPWQRARISYGLRRMGGHQLLTSHLADALLDATQLPGASVLQDNLLLHISNEMMAPGEPVELKAIWIRAVIGAHSAARAWWVIDQALKADLIEGHAVKTILGVDDVVLQNATLTVKGWARVEELLRSGKDSRKAFMAMKFGDPELDAVFSKHFKPAVLEAGFAEGLGRPVVYTCRKDIFDNSKTKPYFDTNHYLTVVWDLA